MLKQTKSPDGYKHLLVYKKAEELLAQTLDFTATFPHEKTLNDLEDQMNRSARSVKANIVEGWKRNATYEYYTFLGYSVASNEELLEDCLDICLGRYEERGIKGVEKKGERGESGPVPNPISPLSPRQRLESLRFYPLNTLLPLSVQLYLRTKEMRMLLDKLQASLQTHMEEKHTLGVADSWRLQQEELQGKEDFIQDMIRKEGLVMTSRGLMKKEEAERRGLEPF